MVGVAQLVEHLVVAQEVVGSSPITHPIKSNQKASKKLLISLWLNVGDDINLRYFIKYLKGLRSEPVTENE